VYEEDQANMPYVHTCVSCIHICIFTQRERSRQVLETASQYEEDMANMYACMYMYVCESDAYMYVYLQRERSRQVLETASQYEEDLANMYACMHMYIHFP
jgi:hypothetical protein